MENKVSKELAWHRLEQAKEDIMACDLNNTLVQINTAKELVKLVEQYLNEKTNNM